jgi:predicted patatin/cPLA2 family phospholipase
MEELCLSGGGTRGVAFIGALAKLEKAGLLKRSKLKKIVATSIGSLISGLYLLGYSTEELLTLALDTYLEDFKDFSTKITSTTISIFKGEKYRNYVQKSCNEKHPYITTLKQLYDITGIHFIVCQTCIEDGIVYMDHINHPDVPVYSAIIASCTLPYIFEPYCINDKTYIDGAVLDNFAMHLLQGGPNSYGIRFIQDSSTDISTLPNFTYKLLDLVYKHIEKIESNTHTHINRKNIIEIDASNFLNFNINNDDKITLYKKGYDSVTNFLQLGSMTESMESREVDELKNEGSIGGGGASGVDCGPNESSL